MNWKKVLHSATCLLVVCAILLTMVPVKAEAVVVGGGLGSVALSLLDLAGYVFSPRVVEDIVAIGNSLSSYLQTWAANNDTVAAVESFFSDCAAFDDISLLGEDDFRLEIPEAIISGVAGWIYAILKRSITIESSTSVSKLTGFSFTNLGYYRSRYPSQCTGFLSYFTDYSAEVIDLIYRSYFERSAIVCFGDSGYLYGFFWLDDGRFCLGKWVNPDGKIHASDFGVYPLDSLVLSNSHSAGVYFSKELCEKRSDFLTSTFVAVNWDGDLITNWSNRAFPVYRKESYNTTWNSSTATHSAYYANLIPEDYYCPFSADDVVWNYVPSDSLEPSAVLGDSYSGVNDGSLSEEDFYYDGLNLAPILSGGDSLLSSMQTVSNQLTTGALTLQDYQDLVSLDTEYVPGTGQLAGTVSALDSDSFFARLQSVLATPFEWLFSGIKAIFVPSEDFLSDKVNTLRERFSFVDSIIGTAEFIRDSINGDASPPVIYIDLSAAEGSYYFGEKEILVDFEWYKRYKESVDILMSAVLWAFFAWRVFQRAPAIIGGDAGVLVRDIAAEKTFGRKKD